MKHGYWAAPVALGAALRFWGLSFGAPILSNLYIRPDESLIVVSGVEFFAKMGVPGTYAYPALFLQMTAVVYALMGGDAAMRFGLDPTPYYLAARALGAVFGTLTIAAVYLAARRFVDRPGAALAALFMAISPLAVRDSHFAVTDIPSVLFQTLTLLFALRYVDAEAGRERRELWLAGLALGLSMSTKYAGLLLVSVLVSAVVVRARRLNERARWGSLLKAIAGAALLFVAVNPYLFLNWAKAWEEIWSIVEVLFFWQPGDPQWTVSYALWQLVKPLRHGPLGWVGLATALAVTAWAVRRRDGRLLMVAQPMVATFLVLLPFQHTVPYRYLLPAAPAIAVLCAVAAMRVERWKAVVAFAVVVLSAPGLWTSWNFVTLLAERDTRSLAGEWIQSNVPRGAPVVWLGGPECEPQFDETAASVGRRIEFAYRRYGPMSGEIVSAPYRLMKTARERAGAGTTEVYRNPPPGAMPRGELYLVTPRYPLRMANFKVPVPPGRLTPAGEPVEFLSLKEGVWDGLELDLIDAWFLPFQPLEGVLRPGPNLRIQKMIYEE